MRIAIYGYGNIGRGNEDMEIAGVFTRRAPETVRTLTGAPVYAAETIANHASGIDAVILCGGSATDLPVQTPKLAELFNVVDSFDTHARIPEHFAAVDAAAKASGHTALISGGWDPGMFSLARLYGSAILPNGKDYTFWGRGVSQGHSDAIRRIPGVLDARQYTVPIQSALDAVRSGAQPELTARQKHLRECYVVAAEGADKAAIETAIKTMPNYFAEYDTTVTFITAEEMRRELEDLRYPQTQKERKRLFAQTFGNFELFVDGKPVVDHERRADRDPLGGRRRPGQKKLLPVQPSTGSSEHLYPPEAQRDHPQAARQPGHCHRPCRV